MDLAGFDRALATGIEPARVRRDAPLAPLTTFRVGGPADRLIDVRTCADLLNVLGAARAAAVPVTVLGGGSNVLVADAGVRGAVVRVRMQDIEQVRGGVVRAGAGVSINGLVRWTIGRELAGLEAWAGTPGTVGGAIFGNAHFGGRNIGELVRRTAAVGNDGGLVEIAAAHMEFGYDTSRLQRTREILVWAEFAVEQASADRLRAIARRSLAHRKATQPLERPSAGCLFQNPDPARDRLPPGLPASAGALVDRAGLKGARVGGAVISPTHANFVVNEGGATARDIRALVERARAAVRDRFGVVLRDEVVYLGEFDDV